jgi:hypothetical protein
LGVGAELVFLVENSDISPLHGHFVPLGRLSRVFFGPNSLSARRSADRIGDFRWTTDELLV